MPRLLRRHTAYAAFAILSLAFAVGAILVVFTVVNALEVNHGGVGQPLVDLRVGSPAQAERDDALGDMLLGDLAVRRLVMARSGSRSTVAGP